jgi:hypothetical protein
MVPAYKEKYFLSLGNVNDFVTINLCVQRNETIIGFRLFFCWRKLPAYTEQSPCWIADNNHSASQEIPRLLWNPKFITVFTRAHPRIFVTFRN